MNVTRLREEPARRRQELARMSSRSAVGISIVTATGASLVAFVACSPGPGSGQCGFPPDTMPKPAGVVFAAKSTPCWGDGDCQLDSVTPRCSAPALARCDTTQPSSQGGICVFQLLGTSTTCNTCYEGDIR